VLLRRAPLALVVPLAFAVTIASAQEEFPLGPDSLPREGVPRGRVEGPFVWDASAVYPGTLRNYWIYVPAQYDPEKAAALLVVQDGLRRAEEWKLPTVLDNLIHAGEVPVTIGVFIDHGIVPAPREGAQPRFNRSFEYDSMGDRYARFLLEEILPAVEERYELSPDPNDRAIAGASSGGICAFTVAWERPDAFRRVLSTIGTYVGLRGGDEYPTLVRKTEPKPIRVFLEDGDRDLNIYAGDWWVANQDMLSALEYAGYDVNHSWGPGGRHSGAHAAQILPDALRWLWRDYPAPIEAGPGPELPSPLLQPGEVWALVSEGHVRTLGPAPAADGSVVFATGEGELHRVALGGGVAPFATASAPVSDLSFGSDGALYACQPDPGRIVRYDAAGTEEILLPQAPCRDVLVLPSGGYYTDPEAGRVWHVSAEGAQRVVADGIGDVSGLVASTDQTLLGVGDASGRFVWSYQIQPDGSLLHGQTYGWVHRRDVASGSGIGGMAVDVQGHVYAATPLGVQVFDQLGRVNTILAKPGDCELADVAFGGPDLGELYATCGGALFRRKLGTSGVLSWQPPVEPPRPGL